MKTLEQGLMEVSMQQHVTCPRCALCGTTHSLSEPVPTPAWFHGGPNVRIVAVERQFVLPLTDGKYDPVRGEFHLVCRDCWEFFTFGGRRQ